MSTWPATRFPAGRLPLFIVGLVLMAAGVFIRQWAIVVLGRFFTADVRVRSGQTVVSRGPYRWVRHPSYSGLIVFFLGLGLALSSWASLALLAVVPTVRAGGAHPLGGAGVAGRARRRVPPLCRDPRPPVPRHMVTRHQRVEPRLRAEPRLRGAPRIWGLDFYESTAGRYASRRRISNAAMAITTTA